MHLHPAVSVSRSLPYALRGLDPARKAEARLAEHGELRDALGLPKAPDHTTLYRFLRRLDEQAFW